MDIESQLNPLSENMVNNNDASIDKQYIDIKFNELFRNIHLLHKATKELIQILVIVTILEVIIVIQTY